MAKNIHIEQLRLIGEEKGIEGLLESYSNPQVFWRDEEAKTLVRQYMRSMVDNSISAQKFREKKLAVLMRHLGIVGEVSGMRAVPPAKQEKRALWQWDQAECMKWLEEAPGIRGQAICEKGIKAIVAFESGEREAEILPVKKAQGSGLELRCEVSRNQSTSSAKNLFKIAELAALNHYQFSWGIVRQDGDSVFYVGDYIPACNVKGSRVVEVLKWICTIANHLQKMRH